MKTIADDRNGFVIVQLSHEEHYGLVRLQEAALEGLHLEHDPYLPRGVTVDGTDISAALRAALFFTNAENAANKLRSLINTLENHYEKNGDGTSAT